MFCRSINLLSASCLGLVFFVLISWWRLEIERSQLGAKQIEKNCSRGWDPFDQIIPHHVLRPNIGFITPLTIIQLQKPRVVMLIHLGAHALKINIALHGDLLRFLVDGDAAVVLPLGPVGGVQPAARRQAAPS